MEFERALFRIHQRALYADGFRKVRVQVERLLPWVIAIFALTLLVLHIEYVGQANCLPEALKHAGFWNTTTATATFPDDALLALIIVEGDELLDLKLRMDSGYLASEGQVVVGDQGNNGDRAENTTLVSSSGVVLLPDPEHIVASYRFALDRELILMRPNIFESHHFKVHNVSISERCLAPSRILNDLFRIFDGFDGLVINELAYTLRSRGYLERMIDGAEAESWAWSAEQVEAAYPAHGRSLFASALRKLYVLFKSTSTCLLISALTGFFIRVAVNGSAVLMFPIAIAAQSLQANPGRFNMRLLERSFPWIGVHVNLLRGRPLWPLFKSHLIFLFLQSFAYLSCNLAWRFILYRKSSPEGFEERIFSFCSILELFNLIFVRTINSTSVFPKVAFGSMVWLHFYVFSALYPLHTLAYCTCTATCAYIMVYCLNHFEEPALRADPFAFTTPTAAHPRALYMPQLSPSWSVESAPLWTMFYPPDPPDTYSAEAMRQISAEEYQMP